MAREFSTRRRIKELSAQEKKMQESREAFEREIALLKRRAAKLEGSKQEVNEGLITKRSLNSIIRSTNLSDELEREEEFYLWELNSDEKLLVAMRVLEKKIDDGEEISKERLLNFVDKILQYFEKRTKKEQTYSKKAYAKHKEYVEYLRDSLEFVLGDLKEECLKDFESESGLVKMHGKSHQLTLEIEGHFLDAIEKLKESVNGGREFLPVFRKAEYLLAALINYEEESKKWLERYVQELRHVKRIIMKNPPKFPR